MSFIMLLNGKVTYFHADSWLDSSLQALYFPVSHSMVRGHSECLVSLDFEREPYSRSTGFMVQNGQG